MIVDENYKDILEILKYQPMIKIDFELNTFYDGLTDIEANNFLKWLEFDLLVQWKINRKINQDQPVESVKKLFSNYAEFFSLKIDYLESWIKGKNQMKPVNLKAIQLRIDNNLSFTKYKNDYLFILKGYLEEDEDNTEKTFIKDQLFSFNEFLSFMVDGTMTKAKKQMLLEDLEKPKTLEKLKQVTEQKIEFLESKLIALEKPSEIEINTKRYNSAILPNFALTFEPLTENNAKNIFYFNDLIRAFVKNINTDFKESQKFNSNARELLNFNAIVGRVLENTFSIFQCYHKYKESKEKYHLNRVKSNSVDLDGFLVNLKQFSQSIIYEALNENQQDALFIKKYCIFKFKSMRYFLSDSLKINIDKSPLKNDFDEVQMELENSINFDELKLLNSVKEVTSSELTESITEKAKTEPKKSDFSVLEWATIFYYADSCQYFQQKNKIEKQAYFIELHKIAKSKNSFKNKVIEANKAINIENNYSIERLKHIRPFIKENYFRGVAKLESDIKILEENEN